MRWMIDAMWARVGWMLGEVLFVVLVVGGVVALLMALVVAEKLVGVVNAKWKNTATTCRSDDAPESRV